MQRKRLKIEPVTVSIDTSLEGIDWAQAKADLAADDFDNGRTPEALRRSFEQSEHVVFARDGERVVGMARLLSDGVCNAYLLDVWTASAYRRRGIGSAMIDRLLECVPGSTSACKQRPTQTRSTSRSASDLSRSSGRRSSAPGSRTMPTAPEVRHCQALGVEQSGARNDG
jgi:GNAT superfamily N-acetyltransferase